MAPNIFMPSRSGTRHQPVSPTSPQPRFSAEERRQAILEEAPELYQNEGPFGSIPNIPVGATWRTREECSKAKMHTPTKAGISGGKNGAYSIVMSGGYADDIDEGDFIVYTGTGGYGEENRYGGGSSWGGDRDQSEDQTFDHKDNNALFISRELGKPVRVIRGHNLKSKYAPCEGYRYDGLYTVTEAYMGKSIDSPYKVCRFKLRRDQGQGPIPERRN